MNRFFSNNLPWKIVSLLVATVLWVFVINTQNPILPKEIKNQSITIKGIDQLEEKGIVIQNEEEIKAMNVRVVIKGPRLEMEKILSNPELLDVKLDLAPYVNILTSNDVESMEKPISLSVVGALDGIEIVDVKPKTVSVVFAKEKSITKTIQPNVHGGTTNEYIAQEPILKPSAVEIKGPKSNVEKVHRAVVDVNVDDFSEDVLTYTVPIKLLDKDGNEVQGVKMSPEQIEVTLPIGKKKKVPLEPQFNGTLPPGYIKSNTIVTPESVVIVGKPDVVDSINTIKLEPISLDNMIQSNNFQAEIILPKGVERIDSVDEYAVVTIEIQKESSYEYIIDTSQMNLKVKGLPSTYELEVLEPTIALILSGTAENLLGFNGKTVEAIIDLESLPEVSPGRYSVPIHISIPDNLKIVNAPGKDALMVEVEIIDTTEETFKPEEEVKPEEPEVPSVEEEPVITE